MVGLGSEYRELKIRNARVDDGNAISHVRVTTWKFAYRNIINDAFLDELQEDGQRHQEHLANLSPNEVQLVAVHQDSVVGWIVGDQSRDDDADSSVYEVRACYVMPSHWGNGTGKRLFHRLCETIDTKSWTRIVAWTLKKSRQSRGFYEKLGFMSDGSEKDVDFGGTVRLIRYAKDFASGSAFPQ